VGGRASGSGKTYPSHPPDLPGVYLPANAGLGRLDTQI